MLTSEEIAGLGQAINEATWRNLHVDPDQRFVAVGLAVLTMPETGPEPDLPDRMIWLRLDGVTRIAASLRRARSDDTEAPAEPIALVDLVEVLRSFDQQPIYGCVRWWSALSTRDRRIDPGHGIVPASDRRDGSH